MAMPLLSNAVAACNHANCGRNRYLMACIAWIVQPIGLSQHLLEQTLLPKPARFYIGFI